MACRINRGQEWSTRLRHELTGKQGSFITLTYDEEHIPEDRSLHLEHPTLFLKRYRKSLGKTRIKYYYCGEYGDKDLRPHYHMIIIGDTFKGDDLVYRGNRKGIARYSSKRLADLWPYGFNECAPAFSSCINYVTGYIRKKLYGEASSFYSIRGIEPPFSRQSNGIGLQFAQDNVGKILDGIGFLSKGNHVGVPRYYRKKFVDKDTVEEFNYQKKAKDKKLHLTEQYECYADYIKALHADQDRRQSDLEAKERLYKKGKL
jgi:hypothetical protein